MLPRLVNADAFRKVRLTKKEVRQQSLPTSFLDAPRDQRLQRALQVSALELT
jgi:hypothetical protein